MNEQEQRSRKFSRPSTQPSGLWSGKGYTENSTQPAPQQSTPPCSLRGDAPQKVLYDVRVMRYSFVPNWQAALNEVTRLISKHYVTNAANFKQSRVKATFRTEQSAWRLAAELVEISTSDNASSTATISLNDIYERWTVRYDEGDARN